MFLGSCALMGIRFKVTNPKKPGTYPKYSKDYLLHSQNGPKRNEYDVSYYQLKVTIDPQQKKVSGRVDMKAKALYRLDTLQLDAHRNLKVDSVFVNRVPVNYIRLKDAIWICLRKSMAPDSNFEVSVRYAGKPLVAKKAPWVGGMVWKKDKAGLPWCGVACETEGAYLWWPNKDLVNDEADSMDIYVTAPDQVVSVSNGIYKGNLNTVNGWKISHWHVSYPINNYNVTFYLGNYTCISDTFVSKLNGRKILMSYYVLPNHLNKAFSHFQQAKDYLHFYEKKFGAYPWPKDGYKLVESPYEGMEHQSAIAYGHKYVNDASGIDYIILHETAHEWWGNSVTADDLGDAWLQEGFATYSEALYVEETQGKEAYENYMYWQRLMIKNKRPVARPKDIRYFSYKDEDVYNKGSWLLHSLRTAIQNDTLFFGILRSFRLMHHQQQISSQDFINLVNARTTSGYDWFFRQYLYKREAPVLEYCWQGDYFYYRWLEVEKDFSKMPVELNFGGTIKRVYPNTKVQKIKIESSLGDKVGFSDHKALFGLKRNNQIPLEASE